MGVVPRWGMVWRGESRGPERGKAGVGEAKGGEAKGGFKMDSSLRCATLRMTRLVGGWQGGLVSLSCLPGGRAKASWDSLR